MLEGDNKQKYFFLNQPEVSNAFGAHDNTPLPCKKGRTNVHVVVYPERKWQL